MLGYDGDLTTTAATPVAARVRRELEQDETARAGVGFTRALWQAIRAEEAQLRQDLSPLTGCVALDVFRGGGSDAAPASPTPQGDGGRGINGIARRQIVERTAARELVDLLRTVDGDAAAPASCASPSSPSGPTPFPAWRCKGTPNGLVERAGTWYFTTSKDGPVPTYTHHVALVRGRYMFEARLPGDEMPASLQVGFSAPYDVCPFSVKESVGDMLQSVGFDVVRAITWNGGEARDKLRHCAGGEMLTLTLDLEEGEACIYIDGAFAGRTEVMSLPRLVRMARESGVSVESIVADARATAFCVSLVVNGAVDVNLGDAPLKHPVTGFCPVALAIAATRAIERILPPAVAADVEADAVFAALCSPNLSHYSSALAVAQLFAHQAPTQTAVALAGVVARTVAAEDKNAGLGLQRFFQWVRGAAGDEVAANYVAVFFSALCRIAGAWRVPHPESDTDVACAAVRAIALSIRCERQSGSCVMDACWPRTLSFARDLGQIYSNPCIDGVDGSHVCDLVSVVAASAGDRTALVRWIQTISEDPAVLRRDHAVDDVTRCLFLDDEAAQHRLERIAKDKLIPDETTPRLWCSAMRCLYQIGHREAFLPVPRLLAPFESDSRLGGTLASVVRELNDRSMAIAPNRPAAPLHAVAALTLRPSLRWSLSSVAAIVRGESTADPTTRGREVEALRLLLVNFGTMWTVSMLLMAAAVASRAAEEACVLDPDGVGGLLPMSVVDLIQSAAHLAVEFTGMLGTNELPGGEEETAYVQGTLCRLLPPVMLLPSRLLLARTKSRNPSALEATAQLWSSASRVRTTAEIRYRIGAWLAAFQDFELATAVRDCCYSLFEAEGWSVGLSALGALCSFGARKKFLDAPFDTMLVAPGTPMPELDDASVASCYQAVAAGIAKLLDASSQAPNPAEGKTRMQKREGFVPNAALHQLLSKGNWLLAELEVCARTVLHNPAAAAEVGGRIRALHAVSSHCATFLDLLLRAGSAQVYAREGAAGGIDASSVHLTVDFLCELVARATLPSSLIARAIAQIRSERACPPEALLAPCLSALQWLFVASDDAPMGDASWRREVRRYVTSTALCPSLSIETLLQAADMLPRVMEQARAAWLAATDGMPEHHWVLVQHALPPLVAEGSAWRTVLAEVDGQRAVELSSPTSPLSEDDEVCPLCLTLPVDVAFEPCGHGACQQCTDRFLHTGATTCCLCRQPLTGTKTKRRSPPRDLQQQRAEHMDIASPMPDVNALDFEWVEEGDSEEDDGYTSDEDDGS
jgi:hypothetical protein